MTKYKGKILFMALLVIAFTISTVQADWEVEQIESVYDDGMMTLTGGKFFETPWVEIKSSSIELNSYFAFRGVTIPADSQIISAYLEFTAAFPWNYNQSLDATVYGLYAGDLPSWNPTPDLNSEIQTNTNTVFDIAPLISSAQINVTVTDIVREIYELYSWESNNAMGFKISTAPVSGGVRYQEAYDSDPNASLKLYINYTAAIENTTWYYKGYKIENVTAENTMSFDWWDQTASDQRVTTIQKKDYETHNLTETFPESPDNLVSVGEDLYMVQFNKNAPYNTSLFVTSDRGVTWTNKGTVESGAGSLTAARLNALAYDGAGIIHIGYGDGFDTWYRNYTVSSEIFGTPVMIYDGGFNNQEIRALWDEVHDTIWFTRYGGSPGNSLRNPTVMRRHNGVWESWRNEYDTANNGARQSDITWADDRMYWMCINYQPAIASRRLYAFELLNYSDISSWVPIGNQSFPKYVGAGGDLGTTGTVAFDVGTTTSGDLAVSVEREIDSEEYVVQNIWNPGSLTWSDWLYNLTGFDPASQPEFHAPKMFYGVEDVLSMGLIVEQDSGYSLVYNDWVHFKSWEGTPPGIIAKSTGHTMRNLGGDMNPLNAVGGWEVTTPPNGTDPNPDCLALAITLEDVQACIDTIPGIGETPDDPNPPGTDYPPDGFGELTRFNMRFVFFMVGWILILVPPLMMAFRTFPMKIYLYFILMMVLGFALQWTIGSI